MRATVFLMTVVLSASAVDVASAQTQFESSKLAPGVVVQGNGLESSKLAPGVVLQGSAVESSKLAPGVVVRGASLQSSKMSIGIVVITAPGGIGVIRTPLTHW
jgi:ADP-glucose pyrophosphorylase